MNTTTTTFAILTCLVAGCGKPADEVKSLKDDKEKTGYAVGLNIVSSYRRQEIDMDYDALIQGIKDARAGGPMLLNETEARAVTTRFQQQLLARQQEKLQQLAEVNKQQGEAFLAENKSKPGVVTLPSGLQYKIIKEGDGPIPQPEDSITVSFRGTFINGTEFDNSAKLGQPPTFPLNSPFIFPGWSEALKHMKSGAKWQLYVPANLAYGLAGRPPVIGPNTTLLLEVELLAVHPKVAGPAPGQPLTSDIIKVPSLEEMQKGAQIETIKPEDLEKLQKQQGTPQKQ
jgi:FKBP-type peptidyl-prolyl cis-trans isomerase FklB